nr:MAG TPA: hypothetical protein [Caudoviricetes sp.]
MFLLSVCCLIGCTYIIPPFRAVVKCFEQICLIFFTLSLDFWGFVVYNIVNTKERRFW